jgi:SAM-dependent methyltransferase
MPYEQRALTRWGRYLAGVEQQAVLAAHRHAAAPSVLLDVGAGEGRWSQLLSGLGWRAICTDVNERSLAICQSRLADATFILVDGNAEALPVSDGSVDLILCIEVFSVMPTPWFRREIARALRPSGLLVGVFSNKYSLRGMFKRTVYKLTGSVGLDYYRFGYGTWKASLRRRGFEMLQERGICWMPFSRSSNSPLIGPLVALERWLGLGRFPDVSPWIVFVARKPAP